MTSTLANKNERLVVLRRLTDLLRYKWICHDPTCNGAAHPGLPYPHARPKQVWPESTPTGDNWLIWAIISGRGFGKTRTGAEYVKHRALAEPNHRVAVVVPKFADGRDVCVEGESGLLSILPADRIDTWNRSIGELILTNGSRFRIFSAEEPESLRGYQHHSIWAEEVGTWKYQQATWDMGLMGLRLGDDPKIVVTTTPKPTDLIRSFYADPKAVVTRGSTFENTALPEVILDRLRAQYDGTRLGRQELYGEVLDDVEGALWRYEDISQHRHLDLDNQPDYQRVVVAIDPATTSNKRSDQTGIIVAARDTDGHLYVLADLSGKYTPNEWAKIAVDAYREHSADRIVAEVNNGGDMVENTIRTIDPRVPYTAVTATRGKVLRAEPIAALYEQHRVHHVGEFRDLEDQMCNWTPDTSGSPDRLDALVWAITSLTKPKKAARRVMRFVSDEPEQPGWSL